MIKLAISGAQGRMGQSIARLALADKNFILTALLEREGHPQIGRTEHGLKISADTASLKGCDALIEFTTPEATMANLQVCLRHNLKMVIGTTGLQPDQVLRIEDAAKQIAVVFSSNMSVGVNILFKLTRLTAEKTGKSYTINMSEAHHVHKKDAPSGTAKTLAEIAEKASGCKVDHIESIREGEIIGDHTVVFESAEDTITVSHHAKNRDIFARGALVAARFLMTKDKGLFNMRDVLGLN
jgi:4-hydroxy-tetrahydrodipicolinate reductase